MKHLSIELTVISPLALRSDHASGGAATSRIIAGTTLAGGLASVHRLLYAERIEEFEALFLSGQVHYPYLYPANFKESKMQETSLPVYPVPKTAQSCKKNKGFLSFKKNEIRHGVRDCLLDWAIFKLRSEDGSRESAIAALPELQRHCLCAECNELMHHFDGYYRRGDVRPYHYISAVSDNTRLQTRTGISREWGTVQEGILYNREVIEDGSRLWGTVKLPDELVSKFSDLLREIAGDVSASTNDSQRGGGLLHIGTGRTRGLGLVDIRERSGEIHTFDTFKQRLLSFDFVLRKRAKNAKIQNIEPFYFVMTLQSPMILRDHLLRYRGTIDGKTLADSIGLSSSVFHQIYQSASGRRITGWQELWGTPRINEYAIDIGSVFLFASSLGPDDELLHRLFELEEEGMGQRRGEGFGRICLSDPFHWEGDLH